jgi:hypothetical protein
MTRADLHRLPSWPAAAAVVLVGVLVLLLRAGALLAALPADGLGRLAGLAAGVDEALTARWGVAPAGAALMLVQPSPWGSRVDGAEAAKGWGPG